MAIISKGNNNNGSGPGPGTDTNFANTNLVADSDREHNWDGRALALLNLGQFYLGNDFGYPILDTYANGFFPVLDIFAQLRIESGNPGEGKVLTSDATGNATWEDNFPSLTATQIAFGDGGNKMTSEAAFWYADEYLTVPNITTSKITNYDYYAPDPFNKAGRLDFALNDGYNAILESAFDLTLRANASGGTLHLDASNGSLGSVYHRAAIDFYDHELVLPAVMDVNFSHFFASTYETPTLRFNRGDSVEPQMDYAFRYYNPVFDNGAGVEMTHYYMDIVTGHIRLRSMPANEYANNTAARAAGLPDGVVYSLPVSGDNKILAITF